MIGTTLGHYHILEKLGEGGMGIVYGVEDTKLHRRVALKILPRETASSPERLARFEREVRSVAALDHPNIVTIHSVEEVGGVHFFTMEWVRGRSLSRAIPSGGMSQDEILAIAIPMTSAVAAAHRRGITHRDLKPDNVMLGEEGRLKILDFGLAKLDDSAASREGMTVAASGSVTQEGKILGTVSYMSPEQAEGKPVDARSDVFSLGIVLYQMATGKRPFTGDTPISTLSAILRDTPPSVDVVKRGLAPDFARIVQRCLEKDPNRRFAQAQDLFVELQSLQQKAASGTLDGGPKRRPHAAMLAGAALGVAALAALTPFAISRLRDRGDTGGSVPGRPVREASLAILPFTNASHDPANEPITNGIHDDLLTQVSKIAAIKVISRTSVMEYKDTSRNLKEIAEELDVAHVLEGSVQRSGDRVRINVQLIDADTDRHLWAETYDRELTARNIFEIQGEIARTVAGQLQAALTPDAAGSLAAVPTENLEAYELYRMGIALNDEFSDAQNVVRAAELFEEALELDPKFAVAAAELGNQHAFIYWMYFDHTEERMDRAKAAIDRAFELSPGLIEAHVALGYYYYWRYLDYDRALQEFGKALEQEPNNKDAISGTGSVLRRKGRFPEALNMYRRALELDPRSVSNITTLAETLGLMRQFEEADRTFARAIELTPDVSAAYVVRSLHVVHWNGDLARAEEILDRAEENFGTNGDITSMRGYFAALGRDWSRVLELLNADDGPAAESQFLYLTRDGKRGEALLRLGRTEEAEEHFRKALKEMQDRVAANPEDARFHGELGQMHAYLGHRDDAIREGLRGVELLPIEMDAWRGISRIEELARIYTILGEKDLAIDRLEFLLSRPGELTVALLKIDPAWDPLRGHPRFEKLLGANAAS